jgi:outer membrane biosynthesis protein TonB
MRMKLSVMAILGGALLLASCKQHQEPPVQNEPTEAAQPVAAPPKPAPVAIPKPAAPKPKPKPLPETPAEQQVLDDADATGMTARVNRSAENGAAPAAATNSEQ